MIPNTRREFLADVGRGMFVASLGSTVALDLGLARASAADTPDVLDFGKLEPLVALLQETPTKTLMPTLVARLKEGLDLRTLTAAGALANARSFGGQHYEGYHTFMALAPAFEMSQQFPEVAKALPVLKVLFRNATHIQASGGRKKEVLHPVKAVPLPEGKVGGEALQELTRKRKKEEAEGIFAGLQSTPEDAFNHVMYCVEDDVNVHRTVLAWRSWAMLDFTGKEHAHTLLRQSVRFCCDEAGAGRASAIQKLLPKLLDEHKLLGKKVGTKEGETAWVEELAKIVYSGGRDKAAEAAAAALAEGYSPAAINEAISLAANRLLLNDAGRTEPNGPLKGKGSVHGDSVGLHASDAANAWRQIAKVSNARNTFASVIVAAYHTGGQDKGQLKEAYHTEELEKIRETDPTALLKQAEDAIKAKNQGLSAALVHKYGEAGHSPRAVFELLLKYATSEDGALHAEKYYHTVSEEFATMRAAFKWRQLVALARVTASEYGVTAPGMIEAKRLLGV